MTSRENLFSALYNNFRGNGDSNSCLNSFILIIDSRFDSSINFMSNLDAYNPNVTEKFKFFLYFVINL